MNRRISLRPVLLLGLLFVAASAFAAVYKPAPSITVEPLAPNRSRVTFSYHAPGADTVFLAGKFNEWNATTDPMQKGAGDVFTKSLELPDGIHIYKFVVNGSEWKEDPENPDDKDDGQGGRNSIIRIGPAYTALALPPTPTPGPQVAMTNQPIRWLDDINAAVAQATKEKKRIFAFFSSPEARNSQYVEQTVLPDQRVHSQVTGQYVPLKIDVQKHADLSSKLGVFRGGVIVIYNSNGAGLKKIDSVFTADQLLAELKP